MAVMREVLDWEISKFIDRSAISHLPLCEMHDEIHSKHLSSGGTSLLSQMLRMSPKKLSGADQALAKIFMVRGQQNAGMQAVLIQNTRHLDVSIARGRLFYSVGGLWKGDVSG